MKKPKLDNRADVRQKLKAAIQAVQEEIKNLDRTDPQWKERRRILRLKIYCFKQGV